MKQTTTFLAGIDGGGTSTRAVILDVTGGRCGVGTAGASNYDDVGYDAARDAIGKAMAGAWAQLSAQPQAVAAIFLGMAGVSADADRKQIIAMATELNMAEPGKIHADHDIRVALAGALSGKPGICVIAGTGSSGYGRSEDGTSWRAGGWGGLLDDYGGGYKLGLGALMAVVRGYDGRSKATALTVPILETLGINDIDAIMHRLYVTGITRTEIAGFARIVTAVAGEGDVVAHQLLAAGAEELALVAATIANKLAMTSACVAVTGSTVHKSPLYKQLVYDAIRRQVPTPQISEPELPSVGGALWLAAEAAKLPPQELAAAHALIKRLAPGMPSASKQISP